MKTKTVHNLLDLKEKAPTICELCGEQFGCGANSESCWCAEINLSEDVRRQLSVKFRDCLCRYCLEKYTLSETGK